MSEAVQKLTSKVDFDMGRRDFRFFFEDICGFQLADFHKEWYEMAQNNSKICVIASRDHGKSVFFRCYLLWRMAYNPNTEVLFFSHSQHQSIDHMAKMDELIMTTPALAHLKPKRGWAKQLFKMTNKSSIRAMSVGKAVRGAHPDIVVLDDILSSEAQTQLKAIATWFYTALLPVLHHTAQLCIVGTPFSYTDLYSELKSLDGYAVGEYPAINEATGEPLWPERWNLDALNARKGEMTSIAFTREYLCKPIASESMDFNQQIEKIIELNARFNPVIIELETNNFAMAFNQVLQEISDLPIKPFNMSRMKKEALIHTLQLHFEQRHLLIPYKDEGATRRHMNALLTELSYFTMLESGKMESLGAHDDMVIALALSVQATKEYRENIVILDGETWRNRLGWADA